MGSNEFRAATMGQLRDVVSIRQWPAEADDRAVPGHWEGGLIHGSRSSAIATLVERSARFVQLIKLDAVDSETVTVALRTHIVELPVQLRRSLTWDQGKEMARSKRVSPLAGQRVLGHRSPQN